MIIELDILRFEIMVTMIDAFPNLRSMIIQKLLVDHPEEVAWWQNGLTKLREHELRIHLASDSENRQ